MLRLLAWLGPLILWVLPTWAVSQTPDTSGQGSVIYARRLTEIIKIVGDDYVRPIPREQLVVAGLKGLYQAADKKAPAEVIASARKATDDQARFEQSIQVAFTVRRWYESLGIPVPPALLTATRRMAAEESPLGRFIKESRQKLGSPSLQADQDIHASLKGLITVLDSYSAILRGEQSRRSHSVRSTYGLGWELSERTGSYGPQIKEVTPGGPAQKAGLRPGDELASINGLPAGSHADNLEELLHGDQIEITVHRSAPKAVIQAILKQEEFLPEAGLGLVRRRDNSWDYWLDSAGKIAYLRIAAIEADSSGQVIDLIGNLQKAGLRGLVLDLRWCPGGTLDDARVIAEAFLGDYSFAFFMLPTPVNFAALADVCLDNHCNNAVVRYRPDPRTNEARADVWSKRAPRTFPIFPIVVLINGETTGGAELIAAVLQDNRRALILGQRTRGKGSVQSFVELGDGGRITIPIPNTRLKLTNGLLVRPSGKNLHRFPDSKPSEDWGVRPDPGLEFRISPELSAKLHDWINLISLRPGWSDEALPLDDPDVDPQRLAGLRLLQTIIN